jgi:tRNA-dihydrouridine synthase
MDVVMEYITRNNTTTTNSSSSATNTTTTNSSSSATNTTTTNSSSSATNTTTTANTASSTTTKRTITPNVYLAPMVDGSELAFRILCRNYGVSSCYTPMIRATQITTTLLNGEKIELPRIVPEDRPLIVQLCGREPELLAAAAKALLSHYDGNFDGIDFNLGCPQEIAHKEGIGAYLAENQNLACECVQALKQSVEGTNIRISCKIRLVTPKKENWETTTTATVAFARRLVAAGCTLLACHCRERLSKHDGPIDLVTGAALVRELSPIPVIINGGMNSLEDVQEILKVTNAHGVMIAQGMLKNHRMLMSSDSSLDNLNHSVEILAAEYLDYCEKYLPPSPYYIRKHLRHIFRSKLQGPASDAPKIWRKKWQSEPWRNKLWHLISRSSLTSIWQFRQAVHLFCILSNITNIPESVRKLDYPTFKSIRFRKGKKGNGKLRKEKMYSYQHLN